MTAPTNILPATSTGRDALRLLGAAVLGSAVLAASAQVSLPMWPVPATLQTLAVLLLGALGGSRVGVASVLLYLAEGFAGLPVFAGAAAGPAALMGPTGGFLIGFLPAAWIAGRAGTAAGPIRAGAVLLLAHLVLFVPGLAWLATWVGAERAVLAGFVPFIPGTAVKTALALAVLVATRRPRRD